MCALAIGSSCTSARRTARTFWGVGPTELLAVDGMTHVGGTDNEFTQLMKGLQGERLRQAFKFLDKDQDGYIRPEQFKKIILVRLSHALHAGRRASCMHGM